MPAASSNDLRVLVMAACDTCSARAAGRIPPASTIAISTSRWWNFSMTLLNVSRPLATIGQKQNRTLFLRALYATDTIEKRTFAFAAPQFRGRECAAVHHQLGEAAPADRRRSSTAAARTGLEAFLQYGAGSLPRINAAGGTMTFSGRNAGQYVGN